MTQNPDLQAVAWAFTWLAFSIVALTGALMYFAGELSKKKKR